MLSFADNRTSGKLDLRSLVDVGGGGGGGFRISGGVGSECDEMLESEADSRVSIAGGSAMLDVSSSLSSAGASTLIAQNASLSLRVGKISMKGINSDP